MKNEQWRNITKSTRTGELKRSFKPRFIAQAGSRKVARLKGYPRRKAMEFCGSWGTDAKSRPQAPARLSGGGAEGVDNAFNEG